MGRSCPNTCSIVLHRISRHKSHGELVSFIFRASWPLAADPNIMREIIPARKEWRITNSKPTFEYSQNHLCAPMPPQAELTTRHKHSKKCTRTSNTKWIDPMKQSGDHLTKSRHKSKIMNNENCLRVCWTTCFHDYLPHLPAFAEISALY